MPSSKLLSPIRSRTSDRRGRACITSHVGVGRLGTLAYNSFRWRAIRIFNQLPLFLRNTTSSSGCLTGSWSVWSHAVTPHSTIYHLVFFSRLLLKFGVQGQSKIGDRWRSSCFLKTKGGHAVMFLMCIGNELNNLIPFHLKLE